jgi:integrase
MALNAKQVEALAKRRQRGRFGIGEGLYLQVTEKGASWLFRFKLNGQARMMGLGAYPDVSLAEARTKALKARADTRSGVDPLEAKHAASQAARRVTTATVAVPSSPSFKEVAETYVAAHRAGWRNYKHAQQWSNTLATYAYPVLGDVPVDELTMAHVRSVLQPIWSTKTETAVRLRGRIEQIIDAARAEGWRTKSENPARWRGNLAMWLPVPSRVAKLEHHAALDWRQVPAIMPILAARPGMAALALRFLILTGVRSGDVRGAPWQEIDEDARLWVIPAGRMKVDEHQRKLRDDHRVPLADAALAILHEIRSRPDQPENPKGLIFPSREGTPLSDMTMTALLRRLGWADAAGKIITAHGFRSSFRDWAGESTVHPREVIEAALAHRIKDKAEAAYARGDLLAKRTALMNDWAAFCTRPPATVTTLKRAPKALTAPVA